MAGPKSKIPPALEPELLKLAGEGRTSEDLAQHLWREHKIEVSSRQVRAFIKRRRDELVDVAKAVVRDELRKRLLPAIRRVARSGQHAEVIERRARNEAKRLREQHDTVNAAKLDQVALKAIDRQLKSANVLLHYAGLNQPDQPGAGAVASNIDATRAALLKRLEQLVQEPGPPPVH